MIDTIAISRTFAARIKRLLKPALAIAKRLEGQQLDFFSSAWEGQLEDVVEELRNIISPEVAAGEAWRVTQQLNSAQLVQWSRQADKLGVRATRGGLEDQILINQAVEQAKLIMSIPEEMADQVAAEVVQAFTDGATVASLSATIQDRTGVAASRADVIARTELAKLNTALAQSRMTAAGVLRYEWTTSRDERVRSSHRRLSGQIFAWDDPPPEGHPGTAINCRCIAIPVLED